MVALSPGSWQYLFPLSQIKIGLFACSCQLPLWKLASLASSRPRLPSVSSEHGPASVTPISSHSLFRGLFFMSDNSVVLWRGHCLGSSSWESRHKLLSGICFLHHGNKASGHFPASFALRNSHMAQFSLGECEKKWHGPLPACPIKSLHTYSPVLSPHNLAGCGW